ncbi:hypothetical protein ACJ72_02630 [Emergomyces africanus]|uniref:Uncharacterized protein n=1 Tax=Emergomyces africanus TaxID=1955775 RepID=A0A1B7P1V9_9EURO|nr:hypothetical protein ACJ72_02630 [Emergomyces africanus]
MTYTGAIGINFSTACELWGWFPEEEAAKLARESWLRSQGLDLATHLSAPSSAAVSFHMTSKFCDFKDDAKDYGIWRREIESKAILIDKSHVLVNNEITPDSQLEGNDINVWKPKETVRVHVEFNEDRTSDAGSIQAESSWMDHENGFKLYHKIAAVTIDGFEKDIMQYANDWRVTVNQINTHGWGPRQGMPKTSVSEIGLDDLIDELVRYKTVVKARIRTRNFRR